MAAGKQVWGGRWSPGGRQVNHESAMCPCRLEGQWYPGFHQEYQQSEGGDPPHLLSPGEVSPGILCPVLGSPAQEKHRHTRVSTLKGH